MDGDKRIKALYSDYNTIIKPLIAEVEARTEQFPLPLFNEIRALHDHIARCYSEGFSESQVDSELHKAERHVLRIMLDCYKCLNLSLHDTVLLFEKQTKHVDLTVLQDGTFYPKYKALRTQAVQTVRKASVASATLDSLCRGIWYRIYSSGRFVLSNSYLIRPQGHQNINQ